MEVAKVIPENFEGGMVNSPLHVYKCLLIFAKDMKYIVL